MSYDSFFNRRVLWTVLLVATFVFCGLIIYNLLSHYKTRCTSQELCSKSYQSGSARLGSENCRTVCNTKECIQIANFILNSMNRSADPCKDFNTFACGNYGDPFERESNHSMFSDFVEDLSLIIKDIIETSNETQIDGSAAQKLKIVYDSCINSKSSDLSAIRSMQQFLNQMGIPNWPHLDSNFSFRNSTFEEIVGKLVSYQEDIFLRFVDWNLLMYPVHDQDLYNISVEPQHRTYHDDWEVEDLKNVVMGILHYTGMDNKDINRTWEEFIDVENGLLNLYIENLEDNTDCNEEEIMESAWIDCSQENTSQENLENNTDCNEEEIMKSAWIDCSQENTSEIMLCRILDSVLRNGGISNYVSKDQVEIRCENTLYIRKLPSVLSSYNHRTLAHYIALRVFINNLKYMGFPVRKNVRYMIKRYTKMEKYIVELDHSKFCVSWVAENMKAPLGLMYVKRMWKKDAIDELDSIVNEYKQTIIQFIQEQDWFDENDKQDLVEKVKEEINFNSFVFKLYTNATKININYRKFHPTRDDFFRNVMNYKKFKFIGKYNMTEAERIVQEIAVFTVQAFGGGGNIGLAFGILLPPNFKYSYPKLFNIARIGAILGHEFGHDIMQFLKPYDGGRGNITNQHVGEIEECFIDQYSRYELKRIKQKVKGNKTINENMCDNMANEVTEKVAEQIIRTMEEENFILPGLPYSPEELFYISYAQLYCETRSIEREYDVFEYDRHSPAEYRIIGPLQNSKRFSEAFNCPSTSYMNPEKKCVIFN